MCVSVCLCVCLYSCNEDTHSCWNPGATRFLQFKVRIQDLVVWGRCRGGKVGKAGRGPWAGPPVQTLILVLVLVLLRLNKEVLIDFPQNRMKGVCVCVCAQMYSWDLICHVTTSPETPPSTSKLLPGLLPQWQLLPAHTWGNHLLHTHTHTQTYWGVKLTFVFVFFIVS